MAYDDLRDWIKTLDKAREIKYIKQEVDPILEMAEIADRVSKLGPPVHAAGGPALLFENIKGHPGAKVFMNQFGSERRMRLALGVDSLNDVADRIRELMNLRSPEGFLDKVRMLPMLAEMGKFFPKIVSAKDAPCKEVILRENFSVLDFPILQCWPQDGGRFITLPCVITRDPRKVDAAGNPAGKRNVGMYRMQVYDGQTTGMHWQRQKVAAEHYRERQRQFAASNSEDPASARVARMAETGGGAMLPVTSAGAGAPFKPTLSEPAASRTGGLSGIEGLPAAGNVTVHTKSSAEILQVAVAIGTDPATTFSAIVPAPPEVEEFIIAGFLRQKPVELVQCETVDLQVPAASEIVLEGYVRLEELRSEGPFGDHTGFYTLPDDYPVFHITCITHRRDPIYATTIVGKPPMEDAWMGKAVERIFLPLMQLTIPEIVDINLPVEAVFHNLMIVSIRKSYPGQARKVMNAIWSLGQAMFTKCVLVVDEDCDVQDMREVVLRVTNNIDPERDIQFTLGPIDSLDQASRLPNYGSKMGIDATRKWAAEGFTRPWPEMLRMDPTTKSRIDALWSKLGL